VEWWYQKDAAENAVQYLAGVTGVTNAITIKPNGLQGISKQPLNRHLHEMLYWMLR